MSTEMPTKKKTSTWVDLVAYLEGPMPAGVTDDDDRAAWTLIRAGASHFIAKIEGVSLVDFDSGAETTRRVRGAASVVMGGGLAGDRASKLRAVLASIGFARHFSGVFHAFPTYADDAAENLAVSLVEIGADFANVDPSLVRAALDPRTNVTGAAATLIVATRALGYPWGPKGEKPGAARGRVQSALDLQWKALLRDPRQKALLGR